MQKYGNLSPPPSPSPVKGEEIFDFLRDHQEYVNKNGHERSVWEKALFRLHDTSTLPQSSQPVSNLLQKERSNPLRISPKSRKTSGPSSYWTYHSFGQRKNLQIEGPVTRQWRWIGKSIPSCSTPIGRMKWPDIRESRSLCSCKDLVFLIKDFYAIEKE